MAYFIGLLLALSFIAILARPILRREPDAPDITKFLSYFEDIQRQRMQVYEGINSLILDSDIGNIPYEEYGEKLSAYRLHAAELLRQQDQLLGEITSLEEEIEDNVIKHRISWGTISEVIACDRCGGQKHLKALFCPRCPAHFGEEVYTEKDSSAKEGAS